MKLLNLPLIALLCSSALYGEKEEHHNHTGESSLKLSYELLDFENSKKKSDGKRYSIELDHQDDNHHYRLHYEKSDTDTTAILPKDLEVHKYALKYGYGLNKKSELNFSYIGIDDNLMKETDGGHIYGVGYRYKALTLTQYLSDYENFNVYQTDLKFGMKRKFNDVLVMGGIIGKYIHLNNKDSNKFTQKADTEYFTTGLKFHAHYHDYHLSAGTYVGKRLFAVMNEGLKVQHHSMEFKESYMLDVGKSFNDVLVHLRYSKHKAKEVPINNDNVKVENISVEVEYKF
ncbi:MAG: hypothetical protein KAG56_07825 [Sulfurovaceae bacterium]|nr:hypothetical protein [Sulfurovaceae bacterium]